MEMVNNNHDWIIEGGMEIWELEMEEKRRILELELVMQEGERGVGFRRRNWFKN